MTEHGVRFTADDIADALGRPRPTPQQRSVIESPLGPALVVAGAGSGKTETMAGRVLWLLANGIVAPGEILGLTFTRKAAGELAQRIRERIGDLAAAGMLGDDYDPFDAPSVATYNSYANALYRDNAAVLGREADGAVLGEAAAWQLARSTVIRSTDARLAGLGKNLDPITRAVLSIARALAENVADPEAVRAFALRMRSLADLPPGGRGEYPEVARIAENVGSLDVLVDLAAEYEAAKSARGLVEYSDQVALALRILELRPSVADVERERYKVVLLDEYQDTSVVQTRLLAALYGGHPVMAVGDPNQSIYGWRGASASNLDDFARAFGAEGSRYALSTSWRNGTRILEAANQIVAPFAQGRAVVERLEASPTASSLPVEVRMLESVVDEAEAVASWLAPKLRSSTPPSAAILLRTRKSQGFFLEALRRHDIPFHVLGIGGLLAEPEVADLVSALTVVHDPSAGLELIRLLAGARWRIGVRDLWALRRLASWLRDRDYAHQRYDEVVAEALAASIAPGEGGSIVDALDFVGTAKPGHGALSEFSDEGLERMRDAADLLARLRSCAGLDLPEFVAVVLQELRLDIEIAANEFRPLGSATIDAFFDAVGSYVALEDVATLGGFLSWLREAEQREDLSPRPEDPEPGTVQVLTIHGSKGLEWDVVAVPRLVEDELPGRPAEGGYQGWLAFGQLPWPFRGDAAELPEFEWEAATTRVELRDAQNDFKARVKEHLLREERRLAYVAVTRARHALLLTGSFWATQSAPRKPSTYLRELAQADLIDAIPDTSELEANPLGDDLERITWPRDPLGSRRPAVEAAARAVREAEPALSGPWASDVQLLIAERRERLEGDSRVDVPVRVPASRFKDYVDDPASVASALRRPMPERPFRATQLGTLFHSWVENRYGVGGDAAELDADVTELDIDDVADLDLDRLRAIFEASPWASRRPVDVEREIHLPFAGRIVICKIDAVYALDDDRFEIVDWKTGKAPKTAAELDEKQLQLALYRLAYAKWKGIDPDRIDAVFYYVAEDRVIRPDRLDDEAALLTRWRAVVA
ncbi:DNA helicase-2/ATP-dependent DNA helicase PcrA [Microbacteriaceae bacterium SG_E_30_P1]|uniref:DNA 3'-5' helicase n=1 Tax=Antiquaquibacter oligotrophicus TaxID=2880260 RepID=A0ABT6KLV4_9MICO|nr:ATP-dependent DNA helicase [Antiquaquibacter oligotrophicus]MDH6180428.1 DNA helicase-2/ATP-dependent DNA helicase PcrA [Antiquaquibacter oligotrophicus]UDF13834.1 ATP-dependent helicase [Antiquaquibacter oligotrophicus]